MFSRPYNHLKVRIIVFFSFIQLMALKLSGRRGNHNNGHPTRRYDDTEIQRWTIENRRFICSSLTRSMCRLINSSMEVFTASVCLLVYVCLYVSRILLIEEGVCVCECYLIFLTTAHPVIWMSCAGQTCKTCQQGVENIHLREGRPEL